MDQHMTVPRTKIVELFEKHVPRTGKADTLGGEIIRAINKIDYRFYNDGDRIGLDYGNETCNSPARFIKENVESAREHIDKMWGLDIDNEYDKLLTKLCEIIRDYVCAYDELFEQPTTKDSIMDYQMEEDEEQYGEDEDGFRDTDDNYYYNCKDKWHYDYKIKEKQNDSKEFKKPNAPIIGADGNVFNLIGICRRSLKDAGFYDKAEELTNKVQSSNSYDEALSVMMEYVNPCTKSEMDDEMD